MKLKFLLVAALFLVLGPAAVKAQEFHLGIEAGGTNSRFENSDASQIQGSRLGLLGGVFANVGFGNFAIQPEALYIRKGGQTLDGSGSFEVDYIEVPVLAKFYFGVPGLNPALLIGPYAAFNTLAQAQSGLISNPTATDLGGIFGFEVSEGALSLSGRWELGATHVTTDTNIQNRNFDLLLGYSFI